MSVRVALEIRRVRNEAGWPHESWPHAIASGLWDSFLWRTSHRGECDCQFTFWGKRLGIGRCHLGEFLERFR